MAFHGKGAWRGGDSFKLVIHLVVLCCLVSLKPEGSIGNPLGAEGGSRGEQDGRKGSSVHAMARRVNDGPSGERVSGGFAQQCGQPAGVGHLAFRDDGEFAFLGFGPRRCDVALGFGQSFEDAGLADLAK